MTEQEVRDIIAAVLAEMQLSNSLSYTRQQINDRLAQTATNQSNISALNAYINTALSAIDGDMADLDAAVHAREKILHEGSNITIDRTDPDNPVINATGGGVGTLTGIGADEILLTVDTTTPAVPKVQPTTALQTAVTKAGTALQSGDLSGIASEAYVDDAVAGEVSERNAAIQNAVADEATARDAAISAHGSDSTTHADIRGDINDINGDISDINALIPSTATPTNKLETADSVDGKIAAAQVANQHWLPAVPTKAELPATIDPSFTWLCRVHADGANNGVWQAIPNGVDNTAVWSFFSDNADFIDETELAAALQDFQDGADSVPTENSTKLVKSGGVFSWFGALPGTLLTTAKTVVGAINELFNKKASKQVGATAGYLAVFDENGDIGGTPLAPYSDSQPQTVTSSPWNSDLNNCVPTPTNHNQSWFSSSLSTPVYNAPGNEGTGTTSVIGRFTVHFISNGSYGQQLLIVSSNPIQMWVRNVGSITDGSRNWTSWQRMAKLTDVFNSTIPDYANYGAIVLSSNGSWTVPDNGTVRFLKQNDTQLQAQINGNGISSSINTELKFLNVAKGDVITFESLSTGSAEIRFMPFRQSGNPNIDENISTAEVRTGKYHLGKPVYRRLFTGTATTPANTYIDVSLLTGVDELVSWGGTVSIDDNRPKLRVGVGTNGVAGTYNTGLQSSNNNVLIFSVKSTYSMTNRPYNVIVEYTKV